MAYQQVTGYPMYTQPYPQPYQDRLAQLQNQYQQTIPQMQPAPQQTINQGLLWVQGEAGAKSYLVAPNTTVLLMDSEGSRFYLKSTDNAGMPNLRTFEYKEILPRSAQSEQPPSDNLDDKYVTRTEYREEYNSLQAKFSEILEKMKSLCPSADDQVKRAVAKVSATKNKGGNGDE